MEELHLTSQQLKLRKKEDYINKLLCFMNDSKCNPRRVFKTKPHKSKYKKRS